MIRLALAVLAIVTAGTAEAAPASAPIGDLVLDYDDTEWQVTARPDGVALQWLGCTGFICDDHPGIFVGIAPAIGPLPAEIPQGEDGFSRPLWELLDAPAPWPSGDAVREVNGFAVFATDRWSGCRAMSPSELTAILDHAGRRYTFTSGVAAACGGAWGVGREAFVEILSSLGPRN